MQFVLENWEWFMLGFYSAEKIVKLTPFKWDDILFDGISAGFRRVFKGRSLS